jgi:hypothetical protein
MRQRLVRSLAIAVLPLVAVAGWFQPASAASSCARLRIPSVGIDRCVVNGNQATIDRGQVVRYGALSSGGRDWIAAHRTSHGGSFRNLTRMRVGDLVQWNGGNYRVAQSSVVDRRRPGAALGWGPLVLQTSRTGSSVYVWRLVKA